MTPIRFLQNLYQTERHIPWLQHGKKYTTSFQEAGVAPNTYILDNEFSKDMRTAFNEKQIHYTFVPPHNHRANAAERAIQTFKNHFIAGLSGLDPNFPIKQ